MNDIGGANLEVSQRQEVAKHSFKTLKDQAKTLISRRLIGGKWDKFQMG